MATQEVLKQGCRRRIGNGKSTKIWQVPWLPCPVNGYLTSDMPEELKEEKVESLFAENQREWDADVLSDICNARDCELIKQIPIPLGNKEDSWFWLFEDKGIFAVKSCYRRLRGEVDCTDRVFWKKLWGLKLPGKVLNFLWRLCRGVLPTVEALRMKSVNVNPNCPWCQLNAENDMPVMFECVFAKEVWLRAGLADVIQPGNNDTIMTLFKRVFQSSTNDRIGMVGMVCWNLWHRRNNWVWNRINGSSFGVQSRSSSMLLDWVRAKEELAKQMIQQNGRNKLWCKPPEGWIKINTDAMCQPRTGNMGVGCIIRDDMGQFVRARSNVIQEHMQPREIEAIGLREALSWTKEWRRDKCIFECDAKGVVDAVNEGGGRSYFHTIIHDCREILKHFNEVLVVFCYRSANTVAHLLAQATCSMSGSQDAV